MSIRNVCALMCLLVPAVVRADGVEKADWKFSFQSGAGQDGVTVVDKAAPYSDAVGYGFEAGPKATVSDHGVTGDNIFYFSAAVPEGSYKVTVTLGSATAEATTTVKAELRRLMLDRVHTAAGEFVTKTITVNVRRPQIPGGGEVRRKAPRETVQENWAWDNKLTLEFIGDHPSVSAIEITKADDLPVIYVCGDSTSTDQSGEPFNSWGQMLTRFFNSDIVVANHGESGETSSSFIGEKRWPKVMSTLKKGDYVFVQFAHNDEKDKGANAGAYKNYETNLERFVKDSHDKGATIVLLTPMNRKTFGADGKVTNSHGDYPDAVRKVAREQGVALIDLAKMSATLYEALGKDKTAAVFANPKEATHQSDYGSYELARCIVEGIKQDNLDLTKYLVNDVPAFDPAHPDDPAEFKIPGEPRRAATATPLGS